MRAQSFIPLRLWREQGGITVVEFAIIAPVILLLVASIIEFALIMFTMTVMESATVMTARLGKTGYVAPGSSRQDQIIASIENRTAGLLDSELINIDTKIYANFDKVGDSEEFTDTNGNGTYNTGEPYNDINGNGQWDEDIGSAGLGDANDVVLYTVSYPWPVMVPTLKPFLGNIFNVTVRTVVKNEPY